MAFDLDISACRARQTRLLAEMRRVRLDLVVVTQHEHVQWLAGPYISRLFQPAAALDGDGRLTLVAPPKKVTAAAADEVVPYEAQSYSTLRNDQRMGSSAALLAALAKRPKPRRLGVEFSSFGPHLARGLDAELIDIEPDLYRLRRRKESDELALLRHAIAATGAMYSRARQIVRPGVNELDVFNELQAVAVRACGEMLTGTGNDYQSNARGGPPRDRAARAGELYILDLGPAFRGYYADNCRTLAVDGRPTDDQRRAGEQLAKVFQHVEHTVRPGKSCRELFDECQAIVDECPVGKFDHHLGHGIGLFPHEAPHLNPNWNDEFEIGDVFTVEPGLYGPPLHAGIRLENDYLVTDNGVELLSDFPLDLA